MRETAFFGMLAVNRYGEIPENGRKQHKEHSFSAFSYKFYKTKPRIKANNKANPKPQKNFHIHFRLPLSSVSQV